MRMPRAMAGIIPRPSPDGNMIAFNSDRTGEMNIWLHSLENRQSRQLTKGGGGDVHAEERVSQLEAENAKLRERVDTAAARTRKMLDRVRLILEGRRVSCDIRFCNIHTIACERCPMLERGWGAHRVIM